MHTQGKLTVFRAGPDKAMSGFCTQAGKPLRAAWIEVPSHPVPPDDECYDNARRLVACWNACEGIDTEALESGLLRQILVELKRQSEAARGEVTV